MEKQDLVREAMKQIGEDQVRFEKAHQDKFDMFTIRCKFRSMYKYSKHQDPAPCCEDKKDPHDWGCSLDECPYIREVKGEQTGREECE